MSEMFSAAVSLPATEGVNVTAIVQLEPTASELPQVVLSPKSPALVPVNEMLILLKAALPVLLRVTDCAELVTLMGSVENVRLVGETPATGAMPVPDRGTVCGLPLPLSLMLSEADRLPLAAGVKVTLIEQLPPAATELPQVFV